MSSSSDGRSDTLMSAQSQLSQMARTAIKSSAIGSQASQHTSIPSRGGGAPSDGSLEPPASVPAVSSLLPPASSGGVGPALTDTPLSTAPASPQIDPIAAARKPHATTLDIPGLTRSKVSPDGRIAQRDVGSKLVVVMVGLPARGKSYIVKKVARYLNWMQHDCRIFNVGNLRRMAAGGNQTSSHGDSENPARPISRRLSSWDDISSDVWRQGDLLPPPAISVPATDNKPSGDELEPVASAADAGAMDQDANFFDPDNMKASQLREQVALDTLDELLDYVLCQGGSVGILDATNSTLERRELIMSHIRRRAGPLLNVVYLESLCLNGSLLEANMRLKLSGPDYINKDPVKSLEDFRRRVQMYEKRYVPLGEYEEQHNMPYIKMIDVGRKFVSHQIRGFLQITLSTYLLNFNLAPRQIWLTRHGESMDNVRGRIGGNTSLSTAGLRYAGALARFISAERAAWEERRRAKLQSTRWPPHPGDATPPNLGYSQQCEAGPRNFCIWTSMLKRSIETVQFFSDDEFDIKQMRMLDELNAGDMDGMTYDEIKTKHADQYAMRKRDKLHYRYPGSGGEGYLDVIHRLQKVIIEVERMTDHVLLVGHRSITRVLLAYFQGLSREDISDLDVPLGVVYCLEPKPYGVDFRAYRFNPSTDGFEFDPHFELRRTTTQQAA